MSNAQHTPGPWHARDGLTQMCDAESTTICNVGPPSANGATWWVFSPAETHGDAETTARLIAAAPEHHEASRSTVERLADLPRLLREENNRALAEIVEEELEKHRAAIAKATGDKA